MLRTVLVLLIMAWFLAPAPSPASLESGTASAPDVGLCCRVLDEPAAGPGPDDRALPISIAATLASTMLPVTGMSDSGLKLIKAAEQFTATPRWDRTQWSVGYGTWTDNPDEMITEARASDLLKERVASISGNIIARSRVPLTQDHVDALTSLAFNIGESALFGHGKREPSTLWKKLQANDFAGAATEFRRWNRAGGVTLPGLTKRRQREAELFRRGNQARE